MSKSKNRNTRARHAFANRRLSLRPLSTSRPSLSFEDRRTFHPDGLLRSPRVIGTTFHSLTATPTRSRSVPFGVGFVTPHKVLLCVRRKLRREVMFAKGGAGRRRMRKPNRNYYSDVRC